MSAAQLAHDQIKDLQQQLLEKDVALKGMQAKVQALNDQAATLHLVAHQLGVLAGEDVIKAVPLAVRQLLAERERLLDGYPEGMTPADVKKIKASNVVMAAQLSSIENLPDQKKPEPAGDYDTLRRQFSSLWAHVNALQQQAKYYRDKDYDATREAALVGSSEINGLRDANQQLTDQLMATEAKLGSITEHATHAAKCQLINEIKAAFVPYDKLTAEQVIDLLCADKESSDAA
jgi:hypothetical protein